MIFWIASYPKSGNTWLRALLSAYYYTKDGDFLEGECLKHIDQFPRKEFFENYEFDKNVPVDNVKYSLNAQQNINKDKKIKFFKTHNALVELNKYQLTNNLYSIGCIYIVRDPRNVISSLSNHFELESTEALDFMLNEKKFIYDYQKKNDYSDFQFLGSWKNHYTSWTNNQIIPIKLVKYEDLAEKTYEVFKDIILFINKICKSKIQFDKNKAKKSIASTSFNKLKKLEIKKGFLEASISKKNNQKIPFFFKGPENHWAKNFNENFISKINAIFEDDLKILNYI